MSTLGQPNDSPDQGGSVDSPGLKDLPPVVSSGGGAPSSSPSDVLQVREVTIYGTVPSNGSGGVSGGGSSALATTAPASNTSLASVLPTGWMLAGLAGLLFLGWIFTHQSAAAPVYSRPQRKSKRRKRARR